MNPSDIFVASLPRHSAVDHVIAACRAGAVGMVDLTWDQRYASDHLARVARYAKQPFAVKLCAEKLPSQLKLLASHRTQLTSVVVSGEVSGSVIASLREQVGGVRLLAEITSKESLVASTSLPLDGVILKGNEASGWVAPETTFLLLQRWAALGEEVCNRLPAWAQGGIGPRTASACVVAGARGVVLDAQVLLAGKSSLHSATESWIRSYDGSQTHLFGECFGASFRFAAPPGAPLVAELRQFELALQEKQDAEPREDIVGQWRAGVERLAAEHQDLRTLIAGQDLAFAKGLADAFVDVRGIVNHISTQSRESVRLASASESLADDSPLASSHGTGLPVVQGPMTRVSDTAEFAESVAQEGGLPLLALALMRGKEAAKVLEQTKEKLGDRGWGAGLLGFLPPEIRNEQIAAIREHRPPLALIAGGRPDQAKELESLGIPSYLHAPSPGLLEMFLRDGARRFVFEGRECGGHVGPRSSFVLWESLVGVLEDFAKRNPKELSQLHLLFAGGIHDGLSAAMAVSIAGRLASLGAKVGVLMGSAYLFTEEAVAAGAIVPRFQEEAIKTRDTVLLQTGPGHAIRCIPTPYQDAFDRQRRLLASQGKTPEEITRELEWMNIGRLRVASKGLERGSVDQGSSKLQEVSSDKQYERGMYMVGQVASLRNESTTIGELHEDVCKRGTKILDEAAIRLQEHETTDGSGSPPPCDIAIVGMSAMYPGAIGLEDYWENILQKHYAVTEVPRDTHWDWKLFYDPDPRAPDKIISKWGGFLTDVPFDPFDYGITPNSIPSIEPLQLLLLESMKKTLADGGYDKREFNRESACAVLGIGGGGSPMGVMYGIRSSLPIVETAPKLPISGDAIYEAVKDHLPEWTEDSFPGILMNVAVGRVANRFNLGGSNYALDAACASSLAAVHACIRELQLGTADVGFAMGADTVQTPYAFMAFSKTHALSPRGRCRPFDAEADGIVLSEGLGIVMLKRLDDAERDGDKIYGVIRGIGSSSDGKDKGLTAPNATGQIRALKRAYDQADIAPSTIGLVEAHGTGTVVGDRTEATSIATILEESGTRKQSVAIGSVKSMIGHSKCAAGVAGLIKATMALHTKTLPPTLVETPSPAIDFPNTALYLNTQSRPWIHGETHPRRAGVSAFGFGGTNVHLVVEEYTDEFAAAEEPSRSKWPAELFLWSAADSPRLQSELTRIHDWLEAGAKPVLAELAFSLAEAFEKSHSTDNACVVAIVAKDLAQLKAHLTEAIKRIVSSEDGDLSDPRGIYVRQLPPKASGKTAVLFPGQGSQYPDMLADLLSAFPQARSRMDHAASFYAADFDGCFAQKIFPPSAFNDDDRARNTQALSDTTIAQPALAATQWSAMQVIDSLGIVPDAFGGHSFGEFVAITAGGAFAFDDLLGLARSRGRAMASASKMDSDGRYEGAMAAVSAGLEAVKKELGSLGLSADVTIANDNSPSQVAISGKRQAVESAIAHLSSKGMRSVKLDVSCAFHSPAVSEAGDVFAKQLDTLKDRTLDGIVYSNTTGRKHELRSPAALETLKTHLSSPVRFREQIQTMYADGVRTFIEVGPGSALTGLVQQTLGDQDHTAVSIDRRGRDGLTQLVQCVAQLIVAGVAVKPSRLFAPRSPNRINLRKLDPTLGTPNYRKSVWMVNGMRNRPIDAPEKHYLGQRHPNADARKPKDKPVSDHPASEKPVSNKTASTTATAATTNSPSATPIVPKAEAPGNVNPQQALQTSNTMPNPSVQQNGAPREMMPAEPTEFDDEATTVMLGYQRLMQQFLQTQRDVMLAYLQGDVPASPEPMAAAISPQPAGAPKAAPLTSHALAQASATSNGNGQSSAPSRPVEPKAPVPVAAASTEPKTSVTEARGQTLVSKVPEATGSANAISSIEDAEQALLELVADRTGYPVDMLDPDADLEGDLGIDSIKRVEILGNLAEVLGLGSSEEELQENLELEKLTTIRTLRGIVEYLGDTIFSDEAKKKSDLAEPEPQSAAAPPAPEPLPTAAPLPAPEPLSDGRIPISRGGVEVVSAPLLGSRSAAFPAGAVVITCDDRGIASRLAAQFEQMDQPVVLLFDEQNEIREASSGNVRAMDVNLSDEQSVHKAADEIRRQYGAIGGLIHLRPLTKFTDDDNLAMRAASDCRSLYLLARELQADLQEAAAAGHAILLAATSIDGCLGYGQDRARSASRSQENEANPSNHDSRIANRITRAAHGGILGFVKCIGLEWPQVTVRAVDVCPLMSVDQVFDCLAAELREVEGPLEVGVTESERVTWKPVDAGLNRDALEDRRDSPIRQATDALPSEVDVVVITGGARGITAEIAVGIAERFRPHLVLLGRTEYRDEEPAEVAGATSESEIKKALIQAARDQGHQPKLAEIGSKTKMILASREIRRTINRIEAAGGSVDYQTADVSDSKAFRKHLLWLQEQHPIAGFIHGAGVIEDKLLQDKTPESFDRVFNTKVNSAAVLIDSLDPSTLKFVAFFASVASRFGNRGQSDYAAANEVLGKVACALNHEWPDTRTFAVAWGPWAEVGMVADLEKHLTARGLTLIPPEVGVKLFIDEICAVEDSIAEVIIAGGAEQLATPN